MRHHALLVSHQTNERVDVTLDVVDGHVEMFVAETSVGRWPIARFVGAPGVDGFHLTTDGDTWTVAPRDRPLFEADALSRLARRSRAYLVNRYPRATRAFEAIRNGGLKRHLTRLLTVSSLAMISFGFGIIAGRFRLDGGNVSAWIFVGLVLGGSVVVTHLLSAPTQSPRATADRGPRDQAALDQLMSTLQFLEPSSPPLAPKTSDHHSETVAGESGEFTSVNEDKEPSDLALADSESGSQSTNETETPDQTSPDRVSPGLPIQVADEVPEVPRHRVGRPSHPEPVVDRGRIRLPGGRQQFPRAGADQDSTNPVFLFEVERADDLTTIHGIGPAFAALLNDVGIHSFRQLASIDDATLSQIRDLMGPFAGRIERDGWIEGAARAYENQRERNTLPAS